MMTPMMNAYPLSQAARLSPINTFPSTMMNPPWYNPVMYNNVAYPTMLPHNMMPQQHQYQQVLLSSFDSTDFLMTNFFNF